MKRLLVLLLIAITATAGAQPIKNRIGLNDIVTPRAKQPRIHEGAGSMSFGQIAPMRDVPMQTPVTYLHAGLLYGKSGIGQHFHHTMEEMYVLLEGEAEFTINGRTAVIKAPAMVPCKLGDAHGLYNPSDKTLRWLNFGVAMRKGGQDAFNLGDDRVGVVLDKTPSFVFGRLDQSLLRENPAPVTANATPAGAAAPQGGRPGFGRGFGGPPAYVGEGVKYRRVLGPEIFKTQWDHVDHVIIPAGKTATRQIDGMEEIFYVVSGNGSVANAEDKGDLKQDNSFYSKVNEKLTFTGGDKDLELIVVGISTTPKTLTLPAGISMVSGVAPAGGAPAGQGGLRNPAPGMGVGIGAGTQTPAAAATKGMSLQMEFVVPKENAEAFEKLYAETYVPAMKVQQGYMGSRLLRIFPEDVEKKIEGEATTYNYQIQIFFDTEANRKKWVSSPQHIRAWPMATSLGKVYKWRGYDVLGADDQQPK